MVYKQKSLRPPYEAPDVSTMLECIETPLLVSADNVGIDDITEENLNW